MTGQPETAEINVGGHSITLSGDRTVMLGRDVDGKYKGYYLLFRSPEAGDTRIRLTDEAPHALMLLYVQDLRDQTKVLSWRIQKPGVEGAIVCEHKP